MTKQKTNKKQKYSTQSLPRKSTEPVHKKVHTKIVQKLVPKVDTPQQTLHQHMRAQMNNAAQDGANIGHALHSHANHMQANHSSDSAHSSHTQGHSPLYYIPTGIKLLSGYLMFIGSIYLLSFLFGISLPTAIFFGSLLQGSSAFMLNLVVLLSIATLIFGFVKRKKWCFDFALIWFGFGIANTVISVFLFPSVIYPVFGKLIFISFISTMVINSLVIWYVSHEKKYFYAKTFRDSPWQNRDKIFVYVLVSFWILTLLICLLLFFSFIKTTLRSVDDSIVELRDNSPLIKQEICFRKEGQEKDVCFVVAAAQEQNKASILAYCNGIDSDLYKLVCIQAMNS